MNERTISLLLVFICMAGAAREPMHAKPLERVRIEDYTLWSAQLYSFCSRVTVTRAPLHESEQTEEVSASLLKPMPVGADCRWQQWSTQRIPRVVDFGSTPRHLLPPLPDVLRFQGGRVFCGVSHDGRYLLGWAGGLMGGEFRVVDSRTEKIVSHCEVRAAYPWSFSGFVNSEHVLGYCSKRSLDTPDRQHRLLAIPLSGRWHIVEGLSADMAVASPTGEQVLLCTVLEEGRICVELRTADLSTSLWRRTLQLEQMDQHLGFPAVIWASDCRLTGVVTHPEHGQGDSAVHCFDARDGLFLRTITVWNRTLEEGLVAIAPRSDLLAPAKAFGVRFGTLPGTSQPSADSAGRAKRQENVSAIKGVR